MAIPLKSKRIIGSDTISVSPNGSVTVNAIVTANVELSRRSAETKHLEFIFDGPFFCDGEMKAKKMARVVTLEEVPALVGKIRGLIQYCDQDRANIANHEELTVDLAPGLTAGAVLYENTVFQDFLSVEDQAYGSARLRLTGGNNLSRVLKICALLTPP
ncbi:MAG: hypothetical protein ACHQ5A_02260 [Opitutales bacterium]